MKRRLLTVACVALLLTGVGLAQDNGDLQKMQGVWDATLLEVSGKKVPNEVNAKTTMRLLIKGNKYTVFVNDKKVAAGTFKLDPSKKPSSIDAKETFGKNEGKTAHGIYRFEGKDLLVAVGDPGEERPKDFKTEEGKEHVLVRYKRVLKK